MGSSRPLAALAGLLASLAISVALWWYFDTFVAFLFVPFVPFLVGRSSESESSVRTCPRCGFTTHDPEYAYCPRDGTELA